MGLITTVTVIYPDQRYIYNDNYPFHETPELDIHLCHAGAADSPSKREMK